jgi:hypothetical protein
VEKQKPVKKPQPVLAKELKMEIKAVSGHPKCTT